MDFFSYFSIFNFFSKGFTSGSVSFIQSDSNRSDFFTRKSKILFQMKVTIYLSIGKYKGTSRQMQLMLGVIIETTSHKS